MIPLLTPLASTIVDQLPTILEQINEHEAIKVTLNIKCDELQSAIDRKRKSLESEREKQKEIRKRIADSKMEIRHKKRLRNDVEGHAGGEFRRSVRPRLGRENTWKGKRSTSKGSTSSVVSVRSKRRGRVFSDDEAIVIASKKCLDED